MTTAMGPEDNMDSGAMMRRAFERGERLESYNPDWLLAEVQQLLRDRGLHPDLPRGTGRTGMAHGAAGTLLRAFGILPAGDHVLIDRINAPEDR